MTSHFFLFGENLTTERLSWVAESLKYFFISLHPDALRHPSREKTPFFIFFLTGEALYSLHDEELLQIWDIILSLPSVWLVCNKDELSLRGLSVSPIKMKNPNIVFDIGDIKKNQSQSFWQEITRVCRQLEPESTCLGYLQLTSPYMNRSSRNSVLCLQTAVEEGMTPEFYAYLDGVHVIHNNQQPVEFRNIGENFAGIDECARKNSLRSLILACGRCAAARGYNTWDDGKGVVISACTIEPCKIRNLTVIAERFSHNHCIMGESAGAVSIPQLTGAAQGLWGKKEPTPPSLVVMITHTPYGMEYTYGGLSFAIACAHQGIATRVIFIEDGIYTLTGTHSAEPDDLFFNMQDMIDAAAGNDHLEFYDYQPSFIRRGIQKNKKLNAVLDIGTNELAQLLFSPPNGVNANHQRILFF